MPRHRLPALTRSSGLPTRPRPVLVRVRRSGPAPAARRGRGLGHKLRNNDRFDALAKRIKQIANQHAEENLVDYKQRRAQLANWTGINPETWTLLQPSPRPHRCRADSPSRRAHAGVWVWCQLTSGHQHAAPIALLTRDLDKHSYFVHHVLPGPRERLLIFAELLLATPTDGACRPPRP